MTTWTLIKPGEDVPQKGPTSYTLYPDTTVAPDEWVRQVSNATGIPENSALLQGSLPLLHRLARQGGLAARYALEGITSLTDPINRVVGLRPAGEVTSRALTSVGVPQPETPLERGVGDVSRALTQAGVTGGASLLARAPGVIAAGSGVRDRVLEALTQRFGLQATSAAGAGAAGSAAREGTPFSPAVDPMGQFIASLVGGIAAPMASPAIVPRVSAGGMWPKSPQTFSDLWRGAKATVRPLTEAGQRKVAGATFNRMATDAAEAQQRMANPYQLVPGSEPTAAEAARDIGISSFQRTMANQPEIGADLAQRAMEQNAARLAALRKTAGTEQELKAAVADREANANVDYETARNTPITISPRDSRIIGKLMDRPSFKRAWTKAEELSAEQNMRPDEISLDNPAFMHNLKKGFDSQLEVPLDKTTKAAITGTKNDFLEVLDNLSPQYAIARGNFAAASPAIDRMTALQTIEPNAQTSAPNILGDPILSQAGFKRAVPKALEPPEGTRVTPEDQAVLDAIQGDLDRSVSSASAGKALGSNTAQNLAGLNVLGQSFGTGGVADPLGQFAAHWMSYPYRWSGVEPAIAKIVNEALLNPELAAKLMREAPMSRASQTLAQIFERGMGPVGAGTAAGLNSTASGSAESQ